MSVDKLATQYGEPSLRDLLKQLKREIFLDMNCHHVAQVQSFNADLQTVICKMNYKRPYIVADPDTKGSTIQLVEFPVMMDLPAIIMSGGTAALEMPIAEGDDCLVLFNDRDIQNWYAGSNSSGPATPRLHAFQDGFALIGVRSKANAYGSYDTTRATLRNGTTGVGVGSSKVKIYNASTTLNTQLQQLLTDLNTFATACEGSSTDPTLVTAATALAAALTTLATNLGALLE